MRRGADRKELIMTDRVYSGSMRKALINVAALTFLFTMAPRARFAQGGPSYGREISAREMQERLKTLP